MTFHGAQAWSNHDNACVNGPYGAVEIIMSRLDPKTLGASLLTLVVAACSGGGSSGQSSEATAADANLPPRAVNDAMNLTGDSSFSIDVMANDSDPDGDALTLIWVDAPAHGTAVIDDNGTPAIPADDTIFYQPPVAFTGAL